MSATDGDAVDLSDLDNVDWSSLQHAYGSAEDVPALIRSLGSSDPVVAADGLHGDPAVFAPCPSQERPKV